MFESLTIITTEPNPMVAADQIASYRVTRLVNIAKNDSPDCIHPRLTSDQTTD